MTRREVYNMGCCGGRAQIRGPWQGQGFIKWVLSEGVRKYDGLLEGKGFIQWVCPTFVFCVLKFGHGSLLIMAYSKLPVAYK